MMHDNMLDYPEGELTQAAISMEDIRQVKSLYTCSVHAKHVLGTSLIDTLISFLGSFCSYYITLYNFNTFVNQFLDNLILQFNIIARL